MIELRYKRLDVSDNMHGIAAANKSQGQVHMKCIAKLKTKDQTHFGTSEGTRGSLKLIFVQLDFILLVFGSFEEMGSNMKDFIDMAARNTVGVSIAVMTPDVVRVALIRRRYRAQLSLAAWRGYATLNLYKTKYVGTEDHERHAWSSKY
jgi:hypothetical protein